MRSFLKTKHYLKQLLTITTASFLVLCIIFAGFYSYRNYQNISHEISLEQEQQMAEKLADISDFWDNCSSTCLVFSSLRIPTSELQSHENYYALSLFLSLQKSHLATNSSFSNIEISLPNQVFFPTPLSHDRSIGRIRAFDIYLEQDPTWPYEFDLQFSATGGLNPVILTAEAYDISSNLLSSNKSQQDYYIAQDGTILLSNQTDHIFQNLNLVYPDLILHTDEDIQQMNYQEYMCTISPVDQYGFRLITMTPFATYRGMYSALLSQTLLLTGVLLTIAFFLTYILVKKVYQPINTMVKMLQAYTSEELQSYQNEIAFITSNIQLYAKEHTQSQLSLAKKLSDIQHAQTAALQNQINAHFLFNTLENIKTISTSELGIDNEVEKSIVLLNKIVHEAIVHKTSIIPLSQEIELAQCYLKLMDLRFPGIQVSWNVPEPLLNCQVFKFSIQPILENCFVHAFRNHSITHINSISIDISCKKEDLEILITDNGHGMSKETKDILITSLNSQQEDNISDHVGIQNIHARIVSVFGNNYGISIPDTDIGTSVCMRYPAVVSKS